MLDCYRDIFVGEQDKFKVEQIVENIRKQPPENKITKVMDKEFRKADLGKFSKSDIAIYIKRGLKKGKVKEEYVSRLLDYLGELAKEKEG